MVNHIWTVLCKKSVVDQESNNISIRDVFEQLKVNAQVKDMSKKFEGVNVSMNFEVVSLWSKDEKDKGFEGKYFVDIISPSGNVEQSVENDLEIPEGMRRMRTRLKVQGFLAKESGDYLFKIFYKDKKMAKKKKVAIIPVEVILNISQSKNITKLES